VLTKEIVDFLPPADIAVFQRQRYLNVDPKICVPYVAIFKKNQPFAGEIHMKLRN
jgi:hypothetical protein